MHAQHGRNYAFFDAPVGLIFTIDRVMKQGSWLDYGMFLQNVMVAARARGLDTCPQAAFTQFHASSRAARARPDGWWCTACRSLASPTRPAIENTLVTEARSGRGLHPVPAELPPRAPLGIFADRVRALRADAARRRDAAPSRAEGRAGRRLASRYELAALTVSSFAGGASASSRRAGGPRVGDAGQPARPAARLRDAGRSFEKSRLPQRLPHLLPDDWKGWFAAGGRVRCRASSTTSPPR